MDVDVYGSTFYALDHNNDGTADYVVDFGDNVDMDDARFCRRSAAR